MKFAIQDPRTLQLLEKATISPWKLVAFFFHDRGSEVQRSLDGMVQEILHSILQQHPSLLSVITPLYLELMKSQRAKNPKWDTLTLQTALLKIARVQNPGVRLCLFLDGLDEHGGDNEKLAVLLKDMVHSTDSGTVRIKVCLASRSWPVFIRHFENCPGFAIHEHTVKDISSYITSRLTPDSLGSQHFLNSNQSAMIAALITEKASGVFIWVRLVIDQLSKDIQDGTPFGDLEHRVMEMPPELEDLYAHTLRRIEATYSDESYMMLQIAYCSISPLSLQTFMECTSHNQVWPSSIHTHVSHQRVTYTTLDTQLRRLASRTGGLLEAISNTAGLSSEGAMIDWQLQGYHVQFIHQTVKEYVGKYRHNLGLARVSNDVQKRNGYFFLLSPNALTGNSNEAWMRSLRNNLFSYAKRLETSIDPSDHEFYHTVLGRVASTLGDSDVGSWLANAPQPWRQYIVEKIEHPITELFPHKPVFNAVAVAANLMLYINNEIMVPPFPHYLETYPLALDQAFLRSLLHVAVAGPDLVQSESVNHCAMIDSLVKLGWPVDGLVVPLPAVPHSPDINHPITPLAYLLTSKYLNNRNEETRLQIAKRLLQLGANVNESFSIRFSKDSELMSLLEYCIRYDTAPFVRLLLQHGASQLPSSKYRLGDLAFLRGDKDVIQALKDHGVPFGTFVSEQYAEVETVSEALVNMSYRLPLILPHGQAIR